ncbi:copper amine oxidase N-terminal domain-containing protein [Paenibacillus rhizovicinus]|uniref:Copper amine oxidase N-terminal domain-containing protein n=1 Tax=Paenibacillus rhizovicinus TaxID=2704463 RepID=A0A6C0PAI5_9BACL|nr:copper amine oxidase N-terminal domain-containing protein [Paenibacillus rhizovicinus]QHW35391.1 copper amine oxidase N-terminal domain-containing protein [Paenibacillus rhizovicinus]
MLKYFASAALAGCVLLSCSSAYAALYVNGSVKQEDAITLDGRTLVKLRALTDPSWLVFAYDVKTHIVMAHTKDKSRFLQLRVGEKTALVNGKQVMLDVPAVNRNGFTYVPLRFVSEALGVYIVNDAKEKRVIVRTPAGQEAYNTLLSGDLAEARRIAINLTRVTDGTPPSIGSDVEGWHSTTYTFPEGQALRFTVEMLGATSYYEMNEEGLPVLRWSAYPDKQQEWGKKPEFGASVYFADEFMGGLLEYGKRDAAGKTVQNWRIYDTDNPQGWNIMPIDGEKRVDARP